MDKPLIHYDKRIVRRSISKEYLTKKEYEDFINTLPDRAADAEPLDLEEETKPAPAAPPEISEATGAPDEGEPETLALGGEAEAPAPPAETAPTEEAPAPLPEGGELSATVADQGPDESPVEKKEDGA